MSFSCTGRGYFTPAVEFLKLTHEQICRFDHCWGPRIGENLIKNMDSGMLNALRLVSNLDEISEDEIDLTAEILKKASKAAKLSFWSAFARNEQKRDQSWLNERIRKISQKIVPLVVDASRADAYGRLGMRTSHPGACSREQHDPCGFYLLTTSLAVVGSEALPSGTFLYVFRSNPLEHGAVDIHFNSGSTREAARDSYSTHKATVFPCEMDAI